MHAYWLTLIVPAAWLLASRVSSKSIWTIGGLTSVAGLLTWAYLGTTDAGSLTEVCQSGLHHVVAATDLPLWQLTVGCIVGWLRCRKANVKSDSQHPESAAPA